MFCVYGRGFCIVKVFRYMSIGSVICKCYYIQKREFCHVKKRTRAPVLSYVCCCCFFHARALFCPVQPYEGLAMASDVPNMDEINLSGERILSRSLDSNITMHGEHASERKHA